MRTVYVSVHLLPNVSIDEFKTHHKKKNVKAGKGYSRTCVKRWQFGAGNRQQLEQGLSILYFPRGLLHLNAVEECWN